MVAAWSCLFSETSGMCMVRISRVWDGKHISFFVFGGIFCFDGLGHFCAKYYAGAF